MDYFLYRRTKYGITFSAALISRIYFELKFAVSAKGDIITLYIDHE